jgi:N utilization substance protein A
MKNEFVLAFIEVLEEKQLPRDVIMQALKEAMESAYKRAVNAPKKQDVTAKVDPETGKVTIYTAREVVEEVALPNTEVSLAEARQLFPDCELGDELMIEAPAVDFGRIGAQTARQVIQQKIRDAEHLSQIEYFNKQKGEIISGVVQASNALGVTVGMDLKAEGVLTRKESIPGEHFRPRDRVRALLLDVLENARGPQIILSRGHRNFLRRLLETEVPEIYHGVVEIRSIAREPGQRAKVAVAATQPGIDPVGACVGIRGVRIQAIVRELHDEKIDVIEWNSDPTIYILKAISPARVNGVYINDAAGSNKTATVVVPEDQLSLAIGRDGQNARLAAKLTGWRIDIKSLPEAAGDALNKIRSNVDFRAIFEAETENIPVVDGILQKKVEGRPLSPEEFDQLAKFVDRVERKTASKRQAEQKPEDLKRAQILAGIPPRAFELGLDGLGLEDAISSALLEAGYMTQGELVLQYKLDSDAILALQGFGPRMMEEIEAALQKAKLLPAPVVPQEASTPAAAEKAEEAEQPVPVAEPDQAEIQKPEEEEEQPIDMQRIFELNPEVLVATPSEDEEDEDGSKKDGGKKKKKKFVEITYDPDTDTTTAKKKHKRGDGWGEWDE